ncbi:MAG: nuclear transport factor 2 family protein, partial [Pseudomonadota bacterium]
MRHFLAPATLGLSLVLVLAGCSKKEEMEGPQQAAQQQTMPAASPQDVLNHHEATMKAGKLDGVMEDYADNAVLIAPAGVVAGEPDVQGTNVFVGKENVRKFFAVLTNAENNPAVASMSATYEIKDDGAALMHWAQWPGTKKEVSGTDVWIIRDGKV